jgi:hypothetical protein
MFLSAVFVPGAPTVAKAFVVAVVTTAVDVHPATVVSNVSSVPAVIGAPAIDGVFSVEHPLFKCYFHCFCVPAVGPP